MLHGLQDDNLLIKLLGEIVYHLTNLSKQMASNMPFRRLRLRSQRRSEGKVEFFLLFCVVRPPLSTLSQIPTEGRKQRILWNRSSLLQQMWAIASTSRSGDWDKKNTFSLTLLFNYLWLQARGDILKTLISFGEKSANPSRMLRFSGLKK